MAGYGVRRGSFSQTFHSQRPALPRSKARFLYVCWGRQEVVVGGRWRGLGRKRFSYPPFRRQSTRLQTGSENKKLLHLGRWAPGSRRISILPSPRPSQPSLPLLPTHPLTLPQLQQGTEKSRGEREPGDFEPRILLPSARGWGSGGRRSYRGWEGKSKGLGITHRGPARAAAPSLAPWAGGKRGERAGPPGWEWGSRPVRPAPSPPARRARTGTAPPPSLRARPSSPTLLERVGGGADGWGGLQRRCQGGPSLDWWTQAGGHRRNALGRPLAAWVSAKVGYWLRRLQPAWLLAA